MPNISSYFISPLALSALNGIGVTFNGITASDKSGFSVAGAGDVNGDGIDDVVIGAYWVSPGGRTYAGSTYLIFGHRGDWNMPLDLSSLNGTNGVVMDGITAYDGSGYCVASGGDVNGDGIDDMVIGAIGASNYVGSTYLIFGHRGAWSSPFALSNLNGSNGVVINGIGANSYSGWSVSSAGDVNGDGIDDMLIGAPGASPGGVGAAGSAYLIFGHTGAWSTPFALSSLNGANGVVINGIAASDQNGFSVASAGDVNGDGIDDMVIGVPSLSCSASSTYLIFGHTGAWSSSLTRSSLNGANGVVISGNANDPNGISVASAGDVNGDGIDDMLIGAPNAPNTPNYPGSAYLIFGHTGAWNSPFALSSLNGNNGVVINGIAAGDRSGYSVAGARDVNGDGIDDMLIGAPGASPGGVGAAGSGYLIFGHTGAWSTPLALSSLNGPNGIVINGIAVGDSSGSSVAGARDVNGDGLSDLLIGAYNATFGNLTGGGSTYLILGDRLDLSINTLEVSQGGTTILDNNTLSATHPYNPVIDPSIPFTITNVSHGLFSKLNFLQSELSQGLVSFTHDGSIYVPSFEVTVGNWAIAGPKIAVIGFDIPPVLYVNAFAVEQGQTVVVSSQAISATSVYYSPDSLMFIVSNVLHGNFTQTNTTRVLQQFNQSALRTGQVSFVADDSGTAPSYYIAVSDGKFTTRAMSATVNFNTAPILINNGVTLTPGQGKVILNTDDLSAIGTAIPLGDLIFIPSTVNCHFENLNLPGFSLPQFQQSNVRGSQVLFVWDGYTTPFYNMSVSDGALQTLPQPAVVKLSTPAVNTFTTIEGSNNTVRNAIIGGTVSGIISLGFLALRCYLSKRMNGSLKNILVVENATVEQEQEEWKRETLSPVVKEIFNKFKTTGFIGYRNEANTKAYVQGVELLLLEIEKHVVEVHFPKLSITERIRLLGAIVDEIKIQLVKPSGLGGFIKPAFTPEELKASAAAIAKVVAVSVAKEKAVDKIRHTVVERAKTEARIHPVMMRDNEIELAASVSEQKFASEAANQDLIGQPSLETRMRAIEGHFAKFEEHSQKSELRFAKIESSLEQLLGHQSDSNSDKPKMRVVN